jgi:hypothetical protein
MQVQPNAKPTSDEDSALIAEALSYLSQSPPPQHQHQQPQQQQPQQQQQQQQSPLPPQLHPQQHAEMMLHQQQQQQQQQQFAYGHQGPYIAQQQPQPQLQQCCWKMPISSSSFQMRHVHIALISAVAFIVITLVPIPFHDRIRSLFASSSSFSWIPAPDILVKAVLMAFAVVFAESLV